MDYDALAAENNGTVAPTPIDYDALATQNGGEALQQSSTLGAAARGFELGIVPMATAIPAIGAGAAAGELAGGAIGGAIGSVVPVAGTAAGAAVGSTIGGFVGGMAGGFAGGMGGAELQDLALKQLPDSFRKTLGIDQAQLQLDQEKHPYAAQIGGLAPFLFTARPWAAPGVTKAADTAIGRFMGDWRTQKAAGGAIMGAWELGQEALNKDEVDWTKVAVATAFGAVFNHQNKAGQRLMQVGEMPFEPRLTQSRALRAAAANEAGQPRVVVPDKMFNTSGVFSGNNLEPGLFSKRQMDPELFNPTLREISASGIMGPGNTEKTFQGLQERNPVADGVSRMLVEDEQSMLYGPQLPDEGQVGAFARRLDPELFDYRDELMSMADEARAAIDNYRKPSFDEYNDLRSQRSDLESQLAETKNKNEQRRIRTQIRFLTEDIDSTWSRMSGEGQLDETLTNHYRELAAINQSLREIGPEVSAVHRRAAEGLGRGDLIMEVTPFEEAPPPPADTAGVAPELFTAAKGAEAPSAAPTSMTQAMSASGVRVDMAAEKAKIIADRKRQMIEAGRPADEAQADAEMIANRFVARAGWFNGQLGSPYELYLAKSAKITKWEPGVSPTDRNKFAAKSAVVEEQVIQDAASAQETMQIARQRAQDALGTPGQQVEGPFSPEPTEGSVESPSTLPGEAAPITPPTAETEIQPEVQAEITLAPQEPAGPKVGDKITMNETPYKIAEIDDKRVRLQPTKKGATEITLPRQALDQMLGEYEKAIAEPVSEGEKITLGGEVIEGKLAEAIRKKLAEQEAAPAAEPEPIIIPNKEVLVKEPQTLLGFLKGLGGIKDYKGELKGADIRKRFPGLINNKKGMELDKAREAAAEAGYLGADIETAIERSTPDDLIQKILSDEPVYSELDKDQSFEYRAQQNAKAYESNVKSARDEIESLPGIETTNASIREEASRLMIEEGLAPLDAIEEAALRIEINEADLYSIKLDAELGAIFDAEINRRTDSEADRLIREGAKVEKAQGSGQDQGRGRGLEGSVEGSGDGQTQAIDFEGGAQSPDDYIYLQRSGKGKQEAALGAYLKRAKEIWLKPNANPSTIIHENGHDFLEQLKEDAANDMAPDQLRADFDTVKNWVGWKDGQAEFTTKQHEKFARGFERYFYDGIAPSNELAVVFQRFSNWLRQAYQSVVGLNKPNAIPEEIRAVFDRLLTNDPSRVTVARETERSRSVADMHEADAMTADVAQAAPMADRVQAERIRAVAELPKEIQNELAAAADRAGLGGSEAGISTRASGFGGMAEDFGGSVTVASSSTRSANDGSVSESRSEVTKEVTGEPSGDGVGVVPRAAVRFGERAGGQFVDKAGNIRLENLTTQESLKAAIREIAYGNDGFIEARRGVISDVEGLSLAEQIGMDGAENLVNDWVKGQAFNHEEIMALRLLIRESAADLFNKAEAVKNSGDWQTARDYAIAEERHIAIQKTLSGVTAEWGRAGRAFRDISGDMKVKAVEKLFRQNTGSTLYQITERANLLTALDSEQAVSRFVRNSQKTGFARWIQEYWINGLISGVSTHSTYMVANEMLALWKAIPETLTSATVSELARMRGKEVSANERVRFGEVWAQILGAKEGFAPALKAAKGSIKTGVTTLLPGETMRTLPGLQPGQEAVKPEALDAAYTLRQIMPDAFALMRSSREAIIAYGEALKNGMNGETGLGLKYSPLGNTPDVTFRGVRVVPVGSIIRTPGRSIQGIHAFHRVQMYFMEINAEAFRKASAELEQGVIKPEQFAQRVSELKLNPDIEMMKRASTGATEGTMMAQGGAWTRKLSALINHTVETGPFRGVQPLKFVDPFIHIASNIINESVLKRTPVGLLSGELRADLSGMNGNLAQEKAIGRMMLGTTVMLGVIGAVKEGFITGGEPSDSVEAAEWRKLHQAYSVKLGDQWYSYHRLGVLGLLMGIAADLTSVTDKLAREELTEAASALTEAFYHNIFEESFLRGPAELFRAIENHERYGPQYIRNFLSSFVPFSVGMSQWARTADPYSRRARTLTDAVKQKIPYVSQELPVRRDLWGEPIKNPTPLYIGGAVPSAIHTFQPSTDPVDIEMERVGVKKAQVDDKIRNVDLTEQQYDDFQRIAGRLTKMQLDGMVRSPKWNQLPDEVKRLRIEQTFDHQREAARNLMMMKYKQIPRDAQALRMGKLMPRPSAP